MPSYISNHRWFFDTEQIIAPFWSGVDIRGTGNVFYRQTTDLDLLARATDQIKSSLPTSSKLLIKNLLIVTWDAVGYYNNQTDKVHNYIYEYVLCMCICNSHNMSINVLPHICISKNIITACPRAYTLGVLMI